ncbi:hypothetical protein CENSYa_0374 [Cenarchaeum symbiosum A]|uniref:Uncharacterized protein n=1 Tax=Cenarchaeum symbiosum (strain A) TaxID=414004 RepID=A0RUJ3_CENSY|nr:hypothetical protein CENSYa_0374 [Cenarchaeum symbiosum A]
MEQSVEEKVKELSDEEVKNLYEGAMQKIGQLAMSRDESAGNPSSEDYEKKLGQMTLSRYESAKKLDEIISLLQILLGEIHAQKSQERSHSRKHGNKICITTNRP